MPNPDERFEVQDPEARRALTTLAILLDADTPADYVWGLFLLARKDGEAVTWLSNADRDDMIRVVRAWLVRQEAVPRPASEPEWLGRLRFALGVIRGNRDGRVTVLHEDLLEAVGAAAPGPGATCQVGLDPEGPMVMVDFGTLVRFVRFTEEEARGMAASLLRKADLLAGLPAFDRAAVQAAALALEEGEGWACEGGPGHDDPDHSGLCIRCKRVSDGSAPQRSDVVRWLRALGGILPEGR